MAKDPNFTEPGILQARVETAWCQRKPCSVGMCALHIDKKEGHKEHEQALVFSLFPCELQIAPAEGPDVSERMVIITGPPEAQFKVSAKDISTLQAVGTKARLFWETHTCPFLLLFAGLTLLCPVFLHCPGQVGCLCSLQRHHWSSPLSSRQGCPSGSGALAW